MLPMAQEDQIKEVMNRFQSFHKKFLEQYS